MSEEDVEIARGFTEALNARDVEALVSFCDPSIELHSTFAAVGGVEFYQGHDGIRRWYRDLEEAWGDEIRSELEALFDLGEHTLLVFYVLHGRGRQSRAKVAQTAAAVARSRDGRNVYQKHYAHREDALRDLGLSEDALEPIAP